MATETVNVTGTIANDAVTNAKLANMAAGTHKGRAIGAGTGDPQDLTPDQSSAILDTATDPLMRTSDAVAAFDPLTQNRPNNTTPDLSFHYFPVYDPGDAQSEKTDGVEIKAWLAGEFDALGAAAAALVSANAHSDALVVGLFDDRGNWDASGNLWPATGGSGTAGAVLKGDVWRVSVAGTLGGELADVGDSFRALVDTPGQTASNWALFAANTQQATESVRGTAAIATQAEAEDQASTNDIDIVTPKKWWQAFTVGVTFATAPAALLTSIRSTLLTGLSLASSAAVAATDSILVAFGKLQAFNNLFTTAGLAIARLANPGAVTFLRINADNTATARTAAEMRSDLDVPANAEAILKTFVAAKGDIIGGSANDTPAITSVGTDGQLLIANSANASGLGYAWKTFAQAWIRASTTISNIPAAITWLTGGTGTTRQQPYSLAGYTQIKIDVFVTTIFSGAGSGVLFRYRTSYSATETDYSEIGVGATDCKAAISAAEWNTSGWVDITAAALTDVYIGLFTINGNGTSDPIITQVILSLR